MVFIHVIVHGGAPAPGAPVVPTPLYVPDICVPTVHNTLRTLLLEGTLFNEISKLPHLR